MSDFNILIKYLHSQIQEINEKYNIDFLLEQKQELQKNIAVFETDYRKLDKSVLKNLLVENYNEEISLKKYELFLELIDFFDEIKEYSNEPQIKTCLTYLNEFKELFNKKIREIEQNLTTNRVLFEDEKSKITEILNYFAGYKLSKVLSNHELENLFNFITNSSLDGVIVYNLIREITSENISLYEKKKITKIQDTYSRIQKNSQRILKLISTREEKHIEAKDESIIETLDENTVTLTDEEQKLYDEILEIYRVLKQENFEIYSEMKNLLELIEPSDFTLSDVRKDAYELGGNNRSFWTMVMLDLEKNLLPNFKNNKESISNIFKYLKNLYKEKFISHSEFLSIIPVINTEEMNSFIDEYDLLTDQDQNSIFSLKSILDEEGEQALDEYGSEFSSLELNYYLSLGKLKELISIYYQKTQEDVDNDKKLVEEVLIVELNELKQEILNLFSNIKNLKERIENEKQEDINTLEDEPKEKNKNKLETDNSKIKNLIFLTPVLKDLKMFSQASCQLNLRKKLYNMLNKLENNGDLTRESYAAIKNIIEVKMPTSGGGTIRLFCRYINNNIIVVLLGIEGKEKHSQFQKIISIRTKSDEYSKLIEVLTRGTDENIQETLYDYKKIKNEFWEIFNKEVYNPNENQLKNKLEESSSKSGK